MNWLKTIFLRDNKSAMERFYSLFFLLILAVSIVIRWPYIFVERLWPDEALYAWNAKRIFLEPSIVFSKEIMDFHPPLFSLLLSLMHFFFSPFLACHVFVFLINILGIGAVYCLGKKIHGSFLGCFAALILAFNPLYFSISSYVLIDGVLGVFMILFFLALSQASTRFVTSKDVILGLAVMALIMLKWSGGLVLPLVVLYYWLAFRQWTLRDRLIKTVVPLTFGCLAVGLLLVHNHAILGDWVPQVFSLSNEAYRQPFYFYAKQLMAYVIPALFLPIFVLGLWRVFKCELPDQRVHGIWFLFAFLVISLMVQKDTRFLYPLLPSVVLLVGIGCEFLLLKLENVFKSGWIKPIFLIVISGLIVFADYPNANGLRTQAHTFIGFKEAGDYVKKNIDPSPDAVVLAGSPRMIRYFTDINFKEFGGQIIAIPKTESEFKELVTNTSAEMIMIVDLWERMQPSLVHPLRASNVEYLKSQGFELERIIRKDLVVGKEVSHDKGVVWCLRRPAIKP